MIENKTAFHDEDKDKEKHISIGPTGGLPSYPSASNISSYFSVGAMAEYKLENRFSVQGEFDYSKFDIKNFDYCPFCFGGTLIKGLNQYDIAFGLD